MISLEDTAKYSIEVRDTSGQRKNMLFGNVDEAYEHCVKMSDGTDTAKYEILNVVKYQYMNGNTFAIVLYSALNHMTYTANWEDILGYLA